MAGRESAGLIVVQKRGNARGAKEPYRLHADVRERECRLGRKRPTTGQLVLDLGLPPEREKRARLPKKLALLRQKLRQKAEQEPRFRFYSLYGRILWMETLRAAWDQVRANNGSPGADGISIDQIENSEDGVEGFLEEIQASLQSKSYKPTAVRRVYIEKENGKLRPLGIPTVRDRVVQMATLLILEPIYETDFLDCSYGFRPGRSPHDAMDELEEHVKAGFTSVYDADLKGYFDSIPHDKLMAGIAARVSDGSVLRLIRMWLKVPVLDKDENGKPTARRSRQGTPQGGVISPLLANSFLHWFDVMFHSTLGPQAWANARLVRYADDFVVLARYQGERLVRFIEETLENRLGLVLNREKTKIVDLKKGESLDFLGFTLRVDPDLKGRPWKYLNVFPSKKSRARVRTKIKELTAPKYCFVPVSALIRKLNRQIGGWANYFSHGYPRVAFRDLNHYVRLRLAAHLRRRSQRRYRPPRSKSQYRHLQDLGLRYL